MDELLKLLDENLQYVSHEMNNDKMEITVISNRENAICHYCNQKSQRVHSRYIRSLQDLPIQGKKLKLS